MSNDTFANPLPPPNYVPPHSRDESSNLTNDDFRKLLMTPSASSVREKSSLNTKKLELSSSSKKKFASEAAERRKEKKLYYASLMQEVKEREAELAQKYRDRAKERRENEKNHTNDSDYPNTTGNFRAVGPDFTLNENADRRRQLIEESKYLGGDLEHTHLVKGLDYALLQKIKAEIEKKQQDFDLEEEQDEAKKDDSDEKSTDDEEDDSFDPFKANLKPKIATKTTNAVLASALTKSFQEQTGLKKNLEEMKLAQKTAQKLSIKPSEKQDSDEDESKIVFKTKLARNIYRVLFESKPPKVNELFAPNRMAYVVDLNEEEVDVPVTSMRSKADCPNNETNASLTTNDIVINKLTQILSYLRHGKRDGKKNKKKPVKIEESLIEQKEKPIDKSNNFSIYDDIGDYVPSFAKKSDTSNKSDSSDVKKRNYFGENNEEEKEASLGPSREAATEFIKNINEKYSNKEIEQKKEDKKSTGMIVNFDTDSYSECYPGTRAEEDVNIDSDDEADYSKMDMGGKKGPVNRWDFDSNEEYSSYMGTREAHPKAAYQFGLKMTDGRKTRRGPNEEKKNEKVKLDKEWTQISKLIDKRKQSGGGSDYKKMKY